MPFDSGRGLGSRCVLNQRSPMGDCMTSAPDQISASEPAEAEAGVRRTWVRPTVDRLEAGSAESLSNVIVDTGITQS